MRCAAILILFGLISCASASEPVFNDYRDYGPQDVQLIRRGTSLQAMVDLRRPNEASLHVLFCLGNPSAAQEKPESTFDGVCPPKLQNATDTDILEGKMEANDSTLFIPRLSIAILLPESKSFPFLEDPYPLEDSLGIVTTAILSEDSLFVCDVKSCWKLTKRNIANHTYYVRVRGLFDSPKDGTVLATKQNLRARLVFLEIKDGDTGVWKRYVFPLKNVDAVNDSYLFQRVDLGQYSIATADEPSTIELWDRGASREFVQVILLVFSGALRR